MVPLFICPTSPWVSPIFKALALFFQPAHASLRWCGFGVLLSSLLWKKQKLLRTLKSKDVIVSGRRSGALPGSCHWGSRRETGKAQWHLKASPSAEQGCLLATSHNWWMEQKEPGWGARVYLECSRELWLHTHCRPAQVINNASLWCHPHS